MELQSRPGAHSAENRLRAEGPVTTMGITHTRTRSKAGLHMGILFWGMIILPFYSFLHLLLL